MGCLKSGKSREVERTNLKKRNLIPKKPSKRKNAKRMDDESSEHTEGDGHSPEISQTNPFLSTAKKNSDPYRYSDIKKDHSFIDRTPSSGIS